MNLLDTHTFVWAASKPDRLSSAASKIVQRGDFVVSCVSVWELLMKKGRKSALILDPLPWWNHYVRHFGIHVLPITPDHIVRLDALPGPLGDPFDRIVIAQCIHENLRLVTKDRVIRDYYQGHINVVW